MEIEMLRPLGDPQWPEDPHQHHHGHHSHRGHHHRHHHHSSSEDCSGSEEHRPSGAYPDSYEDPSPPSPHTEVLGPKRWSEQYPECAGSAQSPIALNSRKAMYTPRRSRFCFDMNGYNVRPLNLTLSNNGHTVSAAFNYGRAENAPSVTHKGIPYYLEALHFHWGSSDDVGSEHTIDGNRFPIEMHMVHERLIEANASQYLVVGYMLGECPRSSGAMRELTAMLPAVREPGSSAPMRTIPAGDFMIVPQLRECDLFTYQGSLTTPPCTQSVTWAVSSWPLCITHEQLEAFRSLRNSHGGDLEDNYRPLQPVNQRPVYYVTCF